MCLLAVNCQATITRSLRDEIFPETCPQNRCHITNPFEDEDEDENAPETDLFRGDFLMPETSHQMVVYHSDSLHKGVASCRAKKVEAVCFQALGEFLRLFGLSRNIAACFSVVPVKR